MLLLLLLNPFLSAFLLGSFGRFVGHQGAKLFSIFCLFFNLFYIFKYFTLLLNFTSIYTIYIGNWILSDNFIVE
jgi:hypothetical protein